jgi:osmoprotectant transport system substrate-binding protein
MGAAATGPAVTARPNPEGRDTPMRHPNTVRRPMRVLAGLAAGVLAGTLALSGCGLGEREQTTEVDAGSVDADALKGEKFVVGSKDFDENILLGKMTLLMLSAAGAEVTDKTNIKGSVTTRTALQSGDIDIYWDYTGTGWITYLKQTKPIPDATQQYEAVRDEDLKQNKIVWFPPAKLDNTYAIGVKEETAEELGLETLSDLAELTKTKPDEATMCVESEFAGRDDGFPGMVKAYDMKFKSPPSNLELNVIYSALDKQDPCKFGEIFSTDGRVSSLKLKALVDDKKFFPIYNGAICVRQETAEKYPKLEEVMAPLVETLDSETITELNKRVSVDGESADDVAKEYLADKGFVK